MKFPQQGQTRDDILASLQARKANDVRWEDGRVFAYIYDAGDEAQQLLKDAFGLYLMENGLDRSVLRKLHHSQGALPERLQLR